MQCVRHLCIHTPEEKLFDTVDDIYQTFYIKKSVLVADGPEQADAAMDAVVEELHLACIAHSQLPRDQKEMAWRQHAQGHALLLVTDFVEGVRVIALEYDTSHIVFLEVPPLDLYRDTVRKALRSCTVDCITIVVLYNASAGEKMNTLCEHFNFDDTIVALQGAETSAYYSSEGEMSF